MRILPLVYAPLTTVQEIIDDNSKLEGKLYKKAKSILFKDDPVEHKPVIDWDSVGSKMFWDVIEEYQDPVTQERSIEAVHKKKIFPTYNDLLNFITSLNTYRFIFLKGYFVISDTIEPIFKIVGQNLIYSSFLGRSYKKRGVATLKAAEAIGATGRPSADYTDLARLHRFFHV